MFDRLIEILKANPRKIVFTEGPDARILEAADRLKKGGFLTPILIGAPEEVKAAAVKGGFDIEGLEIIDPATYPGMDEMVEKMVVLRKGKMTAEQCREALSKGNYFGTMLVKMGYADALLGGATYSTADTVRPALQLVKTKPGAHLVSSCFILVRGEEKLAMGDCAINISYEDTLDKEGNVVVSAAGKLAEVAVETARCAQTFGIDPKVAMLSFSTKGSGKGGTVQLSRDATAKAKELAPDAAALHEIAQPRHEHGRLAAAGDGQQQDGPLDRSDGRLLLRIELQTVRAEEARQHFSRRHGHEGAPWPRRACCAAGPDSCGWSPATQTPRRPAR